MKKTKDLLDTARNLISLAAIGIEIVAAICAATESQPGGRAAPKKLKAPRKTAKPAKTQ